MCILGLEFGVIGGLITPVCYYILSENVLCHSTVVCGLRCAFVVCCVVGSNHYQLSSPGSSVGRVGERSPRLQSVVGSNPT